MKDSRSSTVVTRVRTPNFLVIGAAKSGTTALWHSLRQHPEIYMSPRKHTRHFAYEDENPAFRGPPPANPSVPYAVVDDDAYRSLFAGVEGEKAIGEASHSYLYNPEASARIREFAPEMKLVALLRDPVSRAYSHYSQMIRDGREPLRDFVEALGEEEARVRERWWPDFHYVRIGLYHKQLRRYLDLFRRQQIRIYLYEDFRSDPLGMLGDLFGFLGVDTTFVPETAVRYNASGVPKNRVVHGALQRLRAAKPFAERYLPESYYRSLLRAGGGLHNRNLHKPPLPPDVRAGLIEAYFEKDIKKLQDLLGRDLSAWLT